MTLGGDARLAAGARQGRAPGPAVFPMQLELAAAARSGPVSAHATVGAGLPGRNNPWAALLLREHYLMWKQGDTASTGLFVRAGRFLPVFGLRQAEHSFYVRSFVTPLWSESYGAAVAYLKPQWELHLGAFVRDRWRYSAEPGDGASVYGETRLQDTVALGFGAMFVSSADERRLSGGLTAKWTLPVPDLLLAAEVDVVGQEVHSGGGRTHLTALLLGSWIPRRGWMLDLGLNHHDANLAVAALARDAADLNLHWFFDPHIELVWMSRLQLLALGRGGPSSWFTLIQLHYRL